MSTRNTSTRLPEPVLNTHQITETYAFVSRDPNGNEGILSAAFAGAHWPMLASSAETMTLLAPRAIELAQAMAADPRYAGWSVALIKLEHPQILSQDLIADEFTY